MDFRLRGRPSLAASAGVEVSPSKTCSLVAVALGFLGVRIPVPPDVDAEDTRGLLGLGVVVGFADDLLLLVERSRTEHDLLPCLLVNWRLRPQKRRFQPLLVFLVQCEGSLLPDALTAI